MRNRVLALVFLLISAAGLTLAIWLMLRQTAIAASEDRFSRQLLLVDEAIQAGDYNGASALIDACEVPADNLESWKSMLKRARRLRTELGLVAVWSKTAWRALNDLPNEPVLQACAVDAALSTGEPVLAKSLLASLATMPAYVPLAAEVLLTLEDRTVDGFQTQDTLVRKDELLFLNLDSEASPQTWLTCARLTGIEELASNAALAHLEREELNETLALCREHPLMPSREVMELVARYLIGDLYRVKALVDALPLGHRMEPEVYSMMQETGSSQPSGVTDLHQAFPNWSAHAWLMDAWSYYLAGDAAGAEMLLLRGLDFFPDSRDLRLSLGRLRLELEKPAAMEQIIAPWLAINPHDAQADLLLFFARHKDKPWEQLVPALRELATNHPASEAVRDLLAWYTLPWEPGLFFDTLRGTTHANSRYYLALDDLYRGDLEASCGNWLWQWLSMPESWYLYNAALISSATGRLRPALLMLQLIEKDPRIDTELREKVLLLKKKVKQRREELSR